MNLDYSEDQNLLRAGIERFLERHYSFEQRRASIAGAHGLNPDIWAGLAELGLFAHPFAEAVGGLGGERLAFGLMMEAAGRHLLVEPVIASICLAGTCLAEGGSDDQRDSWLAQMMAGEAKLALAHHDFSAGACATARRSGDGWILTGRKAFAEGAATADAIIVSAIDEEGLLRLFIVPSDTPGVRTRAVRLVDDSWAAELVLNEASLNDDLLVPGDATSLLERARHAATLAACWSATGAMGAMLEQTVDYVKQREQFGKPIATFQVVQHVLAEMTVCMEEARSACLLASLIAADTPEQRARGAATAKVKIASGSEVVAKNAVQLHGGMGVSDELPIATYFRKLLAFRTLDGSSEENLDQYVTAVMSKGDHLRSAILPAVDAAPATET